MPQDTEKSLMHLVPWNDPEEPEEELAGSLMSAEEFSAAAKGRAAVEIGRPNSFRNSTTSALSVRTFSGKTFLPYAVATRSLEERNAAPPAPFSLEIFVRARFARKISVKSSRPKYANLTRAQAA